MLVHLDDNLAISSNVINDNKLLIFNKTLSTYLVFNMDLKVFWMLPGGLQKKIAG